VSHRGWKYRSHADEPDSHWLEDFACGFLGGATGFFNFLGWLLVYFGWLGIGSALIVCAAAGLLFGGWLAYENLQEKRSK